MSGPTPFRSVLAHAVALFALLIGVLGLLFSLGALWYGKVPDDEGHSFRNIAVGSAMTAAAGFLLEYYARRRWDDPPPSARGFDVVVRDQQMKEEERRQP